MFIRVSREFAGGNAIGDDDGLNLSTGIGNDRAHKLFETQPHFKDERGIGNSRDILRRGLVLMFI